MESNPGGQIGSGQRGVPFSVQWHGAAVLAVAGDETRALSARHYTRMPLGNRERHVQWRVTRYAGFCLPDWDLEMTLLFSIKTLRISSRHVLSRIIFYIVRGGIGRPNKMSVSLQHFAFSLAAVGFQFSALLSVWW